MLVQNRSQFENARTILLESDLIALDTETIWTDSWDARYMIGISTWCKLAKQFNGEDIELGFYFPFRHEPNKELFPHESDNLPIEWLRELKVCFERTDTTFIFHNAKFDRQVLHKENIDICAPFYDTIIMSFMDDENKFSHELEDLAKLVKEKKPRKELHSIAKNLNGWHKVPPGVMEIYAVSDVRATYQLFHYFKPRLEKQELWSLLPREEQRSRVLTKMEERGIAIDKEIATQLSEQALNQMQEALVEFGYDPMKPSQLAHRLYAKQPEGLGFQPLGYSMRKSVEFAQGLPIMNADLLSRHFLPDGKTLHPEVSKVLEYRSWLKSNSSYYESWFTKVSIDGRLRPSFKQHGTKTTRLSCSKPNMQQIPRFKSPVKKMLKAKEGYELWEFDYSQIEFRLAVAYCKIPELMEGLKGALDVHQMTSELCRIEELTGLPKEEARYIGKQSNFALIYGAGYEVLLDQIWRDARLQLPDHVGVEIHSAFHKSYPGFKSTLWAASRVAKKNKWVKYWTGRKRHFPLAWQAHKAFNSVIQGGAAEIVCDAMIELDKLDYELVCQVHDSVWVELPCEEVEVNVSRIKEIMSAKPTEDFDLPFPVDAKVLAQ